MIHTYCCMHMSKMAIEINVRIVSMLHAYVENGRRNSNEYSVHRGFGGSFWRAPLNYKKEHAPINYETTKKVSFCVCGCLETPAGGGLAKRNGPGAGAKGQEQGEGSGLGLV